MAQLRGVGQVLQNGQEIATVSYDLKQTTPRISTARGEIITGQTSSEGGLRVRDGERIPADAGMLILRLENGAEVPFHLTSISNIGQPNAVYWISVNMPNDM
jgi:hypothetical protein